MDTFKQREHRDPEDAEISSNLIPVEDRMDVGSRKVVSTILGQEVMKSNYVSHVVAHTTPANRLSPLSGHSIHDFHHAHSQAEIEEVCYSPDMLDYFEIQVSSDKISTPDSTVPATSFTSFPLLPIEVQRKIWFHALPSPAFVRTKYTKRWCSDITEAQGLKAQVLLEPAGFKTDSPESLECSSPFDLQFVCYMSRQVFLENYSRLKFIGCNTGQKCREYSDWDDSFEEVTVKAKPGPLFDMRFDNLFLVNMANIGFSLKNYKASLDLTLLRILTVDIFNIRWKDDIEGENDSFWGEVERSCPSLERLFIILNATDVSVEPTQRCLVGIPVSSQLRDFDETLIELLKHRQWIPPSNLLENLEYEKTSSFTICANFAPRTAKNPDYWKQVDLRPVWILHTIPWYNVPRSNVRLLGPFMVVKFIQSLSVPLFFRLNEDGTLPDQYDCVKELFDEDEDEEEDLIFLGNDELSASFSLYQDDSLMRWYPQANIHFPRND